MIAKDEAAAPQRLRLTKGVHIVYRGQISPSAFLLQSRQDKRVFFVIPFHGNSLIGTTDTDYKEKPGDVKAEEGDVQYLLQEAGRVFPNITFDRKKIITTFAGLRPLVADKGHPSKISRKHEIEQHASGIWFVMGGKYTTYRAIAQEAVERALPQLKSQMPFSGDYTLYGSNGANEEVKILSQRYEVSIDLVKYLQGVYGSRFWDVLDLTRANPQLKEKICSCSPAIAAQVVYSRDVEMAQTVEDIMDRRLGLSYLDCPKGDCRRTIENLLTSRR
jgi:glycerol-3-phosphate dehydrogenase